MLQKTIELRDYQQEAVQSVFDYYISGKQGNPIIVAATGAGKSLIIGKLIQRIMTEYAGQRIIMCTHVKELIEQNYLKLVTFWPQAPVGIYSAGIGKKQPWCDIVCGGIQSMYKKAANLGKRSFIFIDECHLLTPEAEGMYMQLITELKKINPYLKVVGFTATDWRTKGGSLIDQKNAIFTDIIYEIGIRDLVNRGYLAPLISKSSLIQADFSNVKKIAGEFNLKQAEEVIDREELTQRALDEIERLAADRKFFLFFCQGVKHSIHIKEALQKRGWQVDVVTGETPKDARAKILSGFKGATKRRALVNNAVLTTGTDLPNVDCIVLLRGTMSSVLYIQMLGRGMRLFPGKKNCLVLDYAGNIDRFGAVDLIKRPRGDHTKADKKENNIAPQKICDNCREPILIMYKECPSCGYIFPDNENIKHSHVATNAAIMTSEIKPERCDILDVIYKSHVGASGIPCLKVSYLDKWGVVANEYIMFSHLGAPRNRALKWAEKMGIIGDYPESTEQALSISDMFKKPTAIYIKKSGKNMEVVNYEFA